MSRVDNDFVNAHFVASCCDLTPGPLSQSVQLLYVPVSADPELTKYCESLLSNTELQRAGRFKSAGDAAMFKQRRAFRRFCGAIALGSSLPLHQVCFIETKKGRPHLAELAATWFSFSSCQSGFLGAWSSLHGVGVDLEHQSMNLEVTELARQFFTASEAKELSGLGGDERLRVFHQFWSLKEAALKSIGEGLPFGLDRFEFELNSNPRVIQAPREYGGAEKFDVRLLAGINSCAALVIRHLF